MGSSPLPYMTLPSHLHSQIAGLSACRYIRSKTFSLTFALLAAFLLLPGIYNFGWGQVQKYFFVVGFFTVTEFFSYAFAKINSSCAVLSYLRILHLKTQGL